VIREVAIGPCGNSKQSWVKHSEKKRTTDYVDMSLGYQIRKSGDLKDEMAE
jgi:hypothetical protein